MLQNANTFSETDILNIYSLELYDKAKELFEKTIHFEKDYDEEKCLRFLRLKDKTIKFAEMYKGYFMAKVALKSV